MNNYKDTKCLQDTQATRSVDAQPPCPHSKNRTPLKACTLPPSKCVLDLLQATNEDYHKHNQNFFTPTNLTNTSSIPKRAEHPRKYTLDERSAALLLVHGIQ
jgi:hypothetical protein